MAIVSSNVKIYSDSTLQTLVKTVNGSTSASQTLSVTGLSEHTQYWAQAEATNSGGVTGKSAAQTFTTLYNRPVVSCGVDNGSLTYNRATFWVNYVGNYPVTNLQLSLTAAGGTPETVQIQNMAGLQTGLDVGHYLTPNTTYTLEVTADYYDDEATATSTFTTPAESAPTVSITGINSITPSGATIGISIS